MNQTRILLVLIISLIFGSALAQNQPTFPTTPNQPTIGQPAIGQPPVGQQMPNQMNPIVGVWETKVVLSPGVPEATDHLYIFPNGMYREEMYFDKFAAAFWEGRYTLTADGTLTQTLSNKSPQICLSEGQCIANEVPQQATAKVTLNNTNEMTVVVPDQSTGQMMTLNYKRIQPPMAGTPGSTTTGSTTTGPTPGSTTTGPISGSTSTGTGSNTGTPGAANTFAQWVGSYTDGDLTVHLGSPQGNYMQKGETFFQLSVQGDEQRLEGAFRTQSGDTFPIVLQRQNGQVLVMSDNLNFTLTPVAPAAPTNPLGN